MLTQNHDPAFQSALAQAEQLGVERGRAQLNDVIEAATAALTWLENNRPAQADAWGCSVLKRLREALIA